jgi:hypothetical protein
VIQLTIFVCFVLCLKSLYSSRVQLPTTVSDRRCRFFLFLVSGPSPLSCCFHLYLPHSRCVHPLHPRPLTTSTPPPPSWLHCQSHHCPQDPLCPAVTSLDGPQTITRPSPGNEAAPPTAMLRHRCRRTTLSQSVSDRSNPSMTVRMVRFLILQPYAQVIKVTEESRKEQKFSFGLDREVQFRKDHLF